MVLFDPETMADNALLRHSDAALMGLRSVLISGHVVLQDGLVADGERRGRLLHKR